MYALKACAISVALVSQAFTMIAFSNMNSTRISVKVKAKKMLSQASMHRIVILFITLVAAYINIANAAPRRCSEKDSIKLVEELIREAFDDEWKSAQMQTLGMVGEAPQMTFEFNNPREFRAYNADIKKRFCEIDMKVTFGKLNGTLQLGGFLNGIDLTKPIKVARRYVVQETEDGTTDLVGLWDDDDN